MPNTRSATKRMKSDMKKGQRNQAVLSELKTLSKKFASAIHHDLEGARTLAQRLVKKLDVAAGKGIIHQKRASRKKSRLTKALTHAQSGSAR